MCIVVTFFFVSFFWCIFASFFFFFSLQHGGDLETAYEVMDAARNMDLADRYLNVKTVRYAHRVNKVEEGEKIVSLFLRVCPFGVFYPSFVFVSLPLRFLFFAATYLLFVLVCFVFFLSLLA